MSVNWARRVANAVKARRSGIRRTVEMLVDEPHAELPRQALQTGGARFVEVDEVGPQDRASLAAAAILLGDVPPSTPRQDRHGVVEQTVLAVVTYAATTRRRRIIAPVPPKPSTSIAQVAGSGTNATGAS